LTATDERLYSSLVKADTLADWAECESPQHCSQVLFADPTELDLSGSADRGGLKALAFSRSSGSADGCAVELRPHADSECAQSSQPQPQPQRSADAPEDLVADARCSSGSGVRKHTAAPPPPVERLSAAPVHLADEAHGAAASGTDRALTHAAQSLGRATRTHTHTHAHDNAGHARTHARTHTCSRRQPRPVCVAH
jgi:hypothetical protein